MRGNGNGRSMTCDNNTCTENGGIIAPGQAAYHTPRGTFHAPGCLTAEERREYIRALEQQTNAMAQRMIAENRAERVGAADQRVPVGRQGVRWAPQPIVS